jgi:DNA sulfur modification protein DndD
MADADELIAFLLPFRLRDFYFTDGDKAMDYVGGKAADRTDEDTLMLSVTQQREQVSEAVNDLLGLDLLLQATERLEKVIRKLEKEISAESGNEMVKRLQEEVDQAVDELERKQMELKKWKSSRANLETDRQKTEAEINKTLAGIGNHAALAAEREQLQRARKLADDEQSQLTKALGELLGDTSLPIALAFPAIKAVFDILKPKFDKGEIPAYYLEYIRRLLKDEQCVCGSPLSHGTELRKKVETRVGESAKVADRDTHLGYVYQDSQRLLSSLERPAGWSHRADDLVRKRRQSQKHTEHIAKRLEEIDSQIGGVKDDALEGLRKHSADLQGYIAQTDVKVTAVKGDIEHLRIQLDGDQSQGVDALRKRLQAAQHRATIDKSKQYGLQAARDILAVMRASYDHIASRDITRLALMMDEMFGEMIVASADRNLARVEIIKHGREYEILIRDANDQAVPMSAINGAARRALTMAFVVGLSRVAETNAPNVVDTPLGMSAGVVRRGLFGVTVKHSSQPIFLLTRDEIHNVEDLLGQYAGQYYTLTGEWHAPEWGHSHNGTQQVLNRKSPRRETLVCDCSHEEYCDVCRRLEDLDTLPKPTPLRMKT